MPLSPECNKFLNDPTINPYTKKNIKLGGPAYRKLAKDCWEDKHHTVYKTICEDFYKKPSVNPFTGTKIKVNGPTSKHLEQKCIRYAKFSPIQEEKQESISYKKKKYSPIAKIPAFKKSPLKVISAPIRLQGAPLKVGSAGPYGLKKSPIKFIKPKELSKKTPSYKSSPKMVLQDVTTPKSSYKSPSRLMQTPKASYKTPKVKTPLGFSPENWENILQSPKKAPLGVIPSAPDLDVWLQKTPSINPYSGVSTLMKTPSYKSPPKMAFQEASISKSPSYRGIGRLMQTPQSYKEGLKSVGAPAVLERQGWWDWMRGRNKISTKNKPKESPEESPKESPEYFLKFY